MPKLFFDSAEVWEQLKHALASPDHSSTLDQHLEYVMRTKGVDSDAAFALLSSVEMPTQEVPAGLWLVKDDGIYLMSNAVAGRDGHVAYAVGFNPTNNVGVWDAAREVVGGDDFEEFLPASMFPEGPYEDPRTRVIIDVQPDAFELIVSFPHNVHLPTQDSPDLSV